jgi:GTP-binding protein Era
LGIVNDDEHQIIFSDTPGVIDPAYKLQENMMDFVHGAFQDADILIYMVETGEKELKDMKLFERLQNTDIPLILLLNKIDTVEQDFVKEQIGIWKERLPKAEIHPISALNKFNLDLGNG